jgi:hypothetical protein
MLDTINYSVTVKGFDSDRGTVNCTVAINDETFSYFLGKGHIKLTRHKKADQLTVLMLREDKLKHRLVKDDMDKIHHLTVIDTPKIESVLECLFLDSDAHDYSFSEWCDNCGYDNDSIKARAMYDACIEEYFKLRKALGSKYNEIKKIVEDISNNVCT